MADLNNYYYTIWHVDEEGNKVSVLQQNEQHTVVDGKVVLKGIPDIYYKVQITNKTNMQEIPIEENITNANQYKVDYYSASGLVIFHPSLDGQVLNFTYYSKGQILIDSSRIATKADGQNVVETLESFIEPFEKSRQEELIRVENENARISAETTRSNNENTRISNENSRKTAETNRVNAENTRVSNENARKTAETNRVNAENTRVSNENARKTAETNRENAENTRASNENARKSAETARENAESARASAESARVSAESARVTAENTRKSNEETRIANENTRINNEGDATKGRIKAENDRVTAENARKSAETARVNAENTRVTAENARKSAETARETAESARASAESARVSAENTRKSNEETRIANENTRINNEGDATKGRIKAENDRVTAENARKSAETARVNAENERVQNENARKTAETARANAESARVTAENARVDAENARKTAETARANAESARVTAENARATAENERKTAENTRNTNTNNAITNLNNAVDAFKLIEPYNSSRSYVPMNKVTYNGSTYQNIVACKGVPPTNTTNWILIAQRGADGTGSGDMSKSTYDTNNDGIVNGADNADTVDGKHASEFVLLGGYIATNTSSNYANYYTKIADLSLTSRYADAAATIDAHLFNGHETLGTARIYFKVRQQNEMGQSPYIDLRIQGHQNVVNSDFIAVVTENSSAKTTVELYYKNRYTHNIMRFTPVLSHNITYYSNQPYIDSLPSGIQKTGSYLQIHADTVDGYHVDDSKSGADSTTNNALWTAYKIKTELNGKANSSHTHTKSQITDFPTSLPANGGNADTVDNYHVDDNKSGTDSTTNNALWTAYKIKTELDKKSNVLVVITTDTRGTGSNTYCKFASIRLATQYQDCNTLFFCHEYIHGSEVTANGLLFFRVKQQNAMGSNPAVYLSLKNAESMDASNFVAVVSTTTTTETIVDLYYYNKTTYSSMRACVIDCSNPPLLSLYNHQTLLTTLPSGTKITCNIGGRIATADKLTTPRKINGVTFDGSADITITADPNSHDHDYQQHKLTNGILCISASSDWNNYVNTGFYMGSNLLNAPPAKNGSHTWWYVLVMTHNTSPGYTVQIATDFNNKVTYQRMKTNGTWGDWVELSRQGHTHTKSQITDFPTLATVATSGNYNDLTNKPTIPTSLPANGGNSDTVDGYHVNDSKSGADSTTNNALWTAYKIKTELDKKSNTHNHPYLPNTIAIASGEATGAVQVGTNTGARATGQYSFAEGNSLASGNYSHAEGNNTYAWGTNGHAEGCGCIAGYGICQNVSSFTTSNGNVVLKIEKASDFSVNDNIILTTTSASNPVIATIIAIDSTNNTITLSGMPSTSVYNVFKSLSYPNDYISSHSEGIKNVACGVGSHAEGYLTKATGNYAHSEGGNTKAIGTSSHAEGQATTAVSPYSHTEGNSTVAWGNNAHAEGFGCFAGYGEYYEVASYTTTSNSATLTLNNVSNFSVGEEILVGSNSTPPSPAIVKISAINTSNKTITIDGNPRTQYLYVFRPQNHVYGFIGSHAEGLTTVASNSGSHAEGTNTVASAIASHAEGYLTKASGNYSHAEGDNTKASGTSSHAEGKETIATSLCSHAEGERTSATGQRSHAEGEYSTASGSASHAEGAYTSASGVASHAEGAYTTASGNYSHATGLYNQAKFAQMVIGQYNVISSASNTTYSATSEAFIIGNGTSTSSRGNAFKVLFDGKTYADGAYSSTGADYSEYFEWLDGNIDNEDRVGYFVTLEGDMIRKANSNDDYILGVVSATPSIVGDNYEAWKNKYLTDEWGRIKYHYVDVPAETKTIHHDAVYEERIIEAVVDENGNIIEEEHIEKILIQDEYDEIIEVTPARQEYVPMINPLWNPEQEYVSREHRKEWSAIGILGKLLVRDDGTCVVNGYCKPNDNGVATASETGYRVMKRISENIVQILIK